MCVFFNYPFLKAFACSVQTAEINTHCCSWMTKVASFCLLLQIYRPFVTTLGENFITPSNIRTYSVIGQRFMAIFVHAERTPDAAFSFNYLLKKNYFLPETDCCTRKQTFVKIVKLMIGDNRKAVLYGGILLQKSFNWDRIVDK